MLLKLLAGMKEHKEIVKTMIKTLIGIAIFNRYVDWVTVKRGYRAIGGEWFLPLLIYLIYKFREELNSIDQER